MEIYYLIDDQVHDLDGLASLLDFIKEVEDILGERPPLVMDSTGHYHIPVC